MLGLSCRTLLPAITVVGIACLFPVLGSWAKPMGIDKLECRVCHDDGTNATVTLRPSTTTPAPGSTVRLTVTIEGPGAAVGGLHLRTNGNGELRLVPGQGTRQEAPDWVTHAQPKVSANGRITFLVDWHAPNQRSHVDFDVSGVAGNNDGTAHGDAVGRDFVTLAVGCGAGSVYYQDLDQDGYGVEGGRITRACSRPDGYAEAVGDCDESNPSLHPGAQEICNGLDDDCNGAIDDGLPLVTLYPDNDNDGFGVASEMTMMGCGPRFRWGLGTEDCDDNDPATYPGATELCDNKDNDCNGRTDDGAVPVCGVGNCRRTAPSCERLSECRPGLPMPERCNLLDDDCDGEVDNGADVELCGADRVCNRAAGRCESAPAGAGGQPGTGGTRGGERRGGTPGCAMGARVRSLWVGVLLPVLVIIGLGRMAMRGSCNKGARRGRSFV